MRHRNASIIVFFDKEGKLLMQDREGIAKFGEEYDFFGGGIEEGETPQQALVRELKEELDYECSDFKFFRRYDFKINEENSRTIYVFYAKSPKLDEVEILEGKRAVFLSPKEALKYKLFPWDDKIILDLIEIGILKEN